MQGKLAKHWVPLVALLGVFGVIYYLFSAFRFSDPDQYYHFALSRHLAETFDLRHFAQVRGMGWDQNFVDKEFLFHLFTGLGWKIWGPRGVLLTCAAMAFANLALIYAIAYEITGERRLALVAAVFPLFLEVYIVKLMVVRAFLLGAVVVLTMIHGLITGRKKTVAASGLIFSLTYHALPVPVTVLIVWLLAERINKRRDSLALWGLLGLAAGVVINPYFPGNIFMMNTAIHVALDQFQANGLNFGPEQVPYRSDDLLQVFRYVFVVMALGFTVLGMRFTGAAAFRKAGKHFQERYIFIGLLTLTFFILLFISPRFAEYLIPFAAIFAVMSLCYFQREKLLTGGFVAILAVGQILLHPFAGMAKTVGEFQRFDNSYFELASAVKPGGYVFNCEWWGGQYVLFSRPDVAMIDLLDPTLLRSSSSEMFAVVTSVREAKTSDPYHILHDILKTDYVLCSDKTPFNAQLLRDPRFQKMQQATNNAGEVYLYHLRAPEDVEAFVDYESRVGFDEWKPFERHMTDPSLVYAQPPHPQECIDFRPSEAELKKMAPYDFFAISGIGDVIIYKDSQVYLKRTPLPEAPMWGEVLVPIQSGKNWVFKICPDDKGRASLGVFLLSHHQQNLYCETTLAKADPKKKPEAKPSLPYEIISDRCESVRAKVLGNQ